MDKSKTWFVGVLIAVFSVFAASLADSFMRASHTRWEKVPKQARPPMYKRRYWLLAMFLIVVVNTSGSLASVAFAESYIVVPIGGLHVVYNMFLANRILGEEIKRSVAVSSVFIMLGIVLILIGAIKEGAEYDWADVQDLLRAPTGVVFLGGSGSLVLGLVLAERLTRMPIFVAMRAGALGAVTSVAIQASVQLAKNGGWDDCWSASVGPWLIVFTTLFVALYQLYSLNRALAQEQALLVVPVVKTVQDIFGSFGGILFYQQYVAFQAVNWTLVVFGILISGASIGVLAVTWPNDPVLVRSNEPRIKSIESLNSQPESSIKSPILLIV